MVELTQRFSSEYAVRPFVEHHQDETFTRLLALTTHPSPHVRGWCSEGVRPRLPWGRKLRVGERLVLTKRQTMRVATTRALYPGRHRVEVQVNGEVVAKSAFSLE